MTGPLFIIGCPRSGTTLLLDLLAGTRAFGYVSTSGSTRDVHESMHGRTRIYDLPAGDLLYAHRSRVLSATSRLGAVGTMAERVVPRAIEPWEFWQELLPNFRPEFGDGPAIDPSSNDLSAEIIDRTQMLVAGLLEQQHRTVFLSKYTDFPRIELMRAVFPTARFIHIRRDAHAVSHSYAVKMESGRFGTWNYRHWWANAWSDPARDHWTSSGETILGFAAHNRNLFVELLDNATTGDPDVLDVTYEQLTDTPRRVLEEILSFARVESRASLDRLIASRRIVNTNHRWRSQRSDEERQLLDDVLSHQLRTPS